MANKPLHIVFTTINDPAPFLSALHSNISFHEHLDEVKVWIVCDRKTPVAAACLAAAEANTGGLFTTVLNDLTQEAEFGRLGIYPRVPWNSDARRNLGYLCALQDGCEVLLCMDDDNFPTGDDLVGDHLKALTDGVTAAHTTIGASGFFNPMSLLWLKPPQITYPRGYPLSLRGKPASAGAEPMMSPVKVGALEGLWRGEPDYDAITWVNDPPKSAGTTLQLGGYVILAIGTWAPLNTQNTSIVRELIPAFMFVPMLCGWDRYGDILAGYFLQAVKGDYNVAFGRPLVEHRRNSHDYAKDMRQEHWGLCLIDWLVDQLRNKFTPSQSTVCGRVLELADFLNHEAVRELPEWAPSFMAGFFHRTAESICQWVNACKALGV